MSERIFSRLGHSNSPGKKTSLFRLLFLTPVFLAAAAFFRGPGVFIRLRISALGLRLLSSRLDRGFVKATVFYPMDSFRYFEFEFSWNALAKLRNLGRFLDVSSPRLLTAAALEKFAFQDATFINPDCADLAQTKALVTAIAPASKCIFESSLLESFSGADSSFDTITSISVIEHIPGDGDILAVRKMWNLLRPGGTLIVSVPCAPKALEEYVDFNEYGLQTPDDHDFVFGQRFYDSISLNERIFSCTGEPTRFAIYGEIEAGSFARNRLAKLAGGAYPYWREPYMMAVEYKPYRNLADLPAWGVIAMEFSKP